jgi:hypothetical protein
LTREGEACRLDNVPAVSEHKEQESEPIVKKAATTTSSECTISLLNA